MNYYLARDGKTYGPYPQEYIPAMVQQGQITPDDLLCPEGGSDWTPLSQLPALMAPAAAPAAAAPAPAGSKLRISTAAASHSPSPAATPAATPEYTRAPQRAGAMEKAAGAWGALKLVGYGVVAVIVIGGAIMALLASQRDKKEIAKLHSLPGWSAFDKANTQIDSESSNAGYGNTSEAAGYSKMLAGMLEEVQRENFKVDRTPRYRGRSKIGRITSAVSAVTAGTGHFQTFVELRKDRAVVLVHIPEFSRYKGSARQEIMEMCWEGALVMFSQLQKEQDKAAPVAAAAAAPTIPSAVPAGSRGGARPVPGARPPAGRLSGGRASTNRAPEVASAPAASKPEPKFSKDLSIVVGVRGRSAYESVFVGAITNPEDSPPAPTKKNVPSHQLLVQWFGDEKPQ